MFNRQINSLESSSQTGLTTVTLSLHEQGSLSLQITPAEENTIDEIKDNLVFEFDQLISQAFHVLEPNPNDRIGVMVHSQTEDGIPVEVGIPFRPAEALNGGLILTMLEDKLNSSETLSLDFDFTFTKRSAPSQAFALQGNQQWHGDHDWFVKVKTSIVQIHPEQDPYRSYNECFYQWIALGCAYLASNDLYPVPDLPLTKTTYKTLIQSRSRFIYRHTLAQHIRSLIGEASLQSVDYLKHVERTLGLRLVIYSFAQGVQLAYPCYEDLPYTDSLPTLFGFAKRSHEGFSHIDFVRKPASLYNTDQSGTRVCMYCFGLYVRKKQCGVDTCKAGTCDRCLYCHTCEGCCPTCNTKHCGYAEAQSSSQLYPFEEKCHHCKMKIYSDVCKQVHQTFCRLFPRRSCEHCGRAQHHGLKCNETKCPMCCAKITFDQRANHQCYLKRQVLKPDHTRYWAYDFETLLDAERKHIPYCCTAWPLYSHPDIETLCDLFPHQFLPGDVLRPVFVFWGIGDPSCGTGVYQFFDLVCHPSMDGTEFFAHNAGKYDSIFIENYMVKVKGLTPTKIQRGLKLMHLSFLETNVSFKDSLNFIPTALRSMSKDFGIEELKKGFFPHSLMTIDYFKQAEEHNFIVPRPPPAAFHLDVSCGSSGQKELDELHSFLQTFYVDDLWNLKQDCIEYCISDTVLLGKTLQVFREKTMQLTDAIPRAPNVEFKSFDPLRYVTGPSAIMRFYMSQLLPFDRIAIIDRYPSLCQIEAIEWFLYTTRFSTHPQILSQFEGIPITGRCSSHIYKYLNCYDHGCPTCYVGTSFNNRNSKTFQQCLEETRAELCSLRTLWNREIITCWSHEWQDLKTKESVQQWLQENNQIVQNSLPLDPRDAYKGGISELYKLRVAGDIQMVDFVSQYPTALLGKSFCPITNEPLSWPMPVGHPTKLVAPKDYIVQDQMGIIKCRILAPPQLYAPFLGYRVASYHTPSSYEVLYGLCRICMETRNESSCTHTPDERSFVGTWTLAEIAYAQTIGYKVLSINEVWEYPEGDSTLFQNFIIPFMITKICCKKDGLVEEDQFTEQGQSIVSYIRTVTGRELQPSDFRDNPAERTIAKLMMNSFYGKWGQRSNWPETRAFKDCDSKQVQQCLHLMSHSDYNLKFAQVIPAEDHNIVLLDVEKKSAALKGDASKNDHIAAYVTAYGRIMLHRIIHAMGEHVIYCDTDSIFHEKVDQPCYQSGFRIGDLELELPQASNWVGNGRKSYVYQKPNGTYVVKQKGISMKRSMLSKFVSESMFDMILKTYTLYKSLLDEDASIDKRSVFKKLKKHPELPTLDVHQRLFKTVKESPLFSYKQTIDMLKKTGFLIWSNKRRVRWADRSDYFLDTLPYGYVDQ